MMAKARLEETDGRNSDVTIFDNFDVAARIGINRNIFRGVGVAGGGGSSTVVITGTPPELITTEDNLAITTEG
jgi:hypothetical protein